MGRGIRPRAAMAFMAMAHLVMANIVMAHMIMAWAFDAVCTRKPAGRAQQAPGAAAS